MSNLWCSHTDGWATLTPGAPAATVAVTCSDLSDPAARASFLYRTTDGGATWNTTPYPGGALRFLDANEGWALGTEINWTSDGGQTWEKRASVDWSGQFSFVGAQAGWAVVRLNGSVALVQTLDGGATWALLAPHVVP
jgi:photosystem II stability/assembly factor-like uncharacterized protein